MRLFWRGLALRLGYLQSDRAAEERSSGIRVVATVLQKYDASVEQDEAEDLLQATIQRYRSRNTTAYFDDCDTWRSLCCRLWRLECNWSANDPNGLAMMLPASTRSDRAMMEQRAQSPTHPLQSKDQRHSRDPRVTRHTCCLFVVCCTKRRAELASGDARSIQKSAPTSSQVRTAASKFSITPQTLCSGTSLEQRRGPTLISNSHEAG